MIKDQINAVKMLLLVGVLILGSVLYTNPCKADDKTEAKAKFKEGMAAIQKENYPAALSAFQGSYKLIPKEALLFNIAMCQKAMFRYVDSILTFKKFIKEAGDKIKPAMKQATKKALKEMTDLVGTLQLENAPNGAKVYVDGKIIGELPAVKIFMLDPGQHTVRVTLKGHKSLDTEITVASGAVVAVRAQLTKVSAWIGVACEDPDAVVRVDDKVVGGCPFEGEVDPGEHRILVSSPGKSSFKKKVNIDSGANVTVAVQFSGGEFTEGPHRGERSGFFKGGVIVISAGVASGIVGAIFAVKASKAADDANSLINGPDESAFNDKDKDATTFQTMEIAGFALAGALMATGVVLFVLDSNKKSSEDDGVAIVPTLGGLTVKF